MNTNKHLDSGNLDQTQVKGVLFPDDRVPKTMIPRDCHLTLECATTPLTYQQKRTIRAHKNER